MSNNQNKEQWENKIEQNNDIEVKMNKLDW